MITSPQNAITGNNKSRHFVILNFTGDTALVFITVFFLLFSFFHIHVYGGARARAVLKTKIRIKLKKEKSARSAEFFLYLSAVYSWTSEAAGDGVQRAAKRC